MIDPDDDGVIRISAAEATGSHVDDLLRRQANLRGEVGIARDRRGTWYLQSWFTLGLAGSFAAFLAWAIIEPHYDDLPYVQGAITAVTSADNDLSAIAAVVAAQAGTPTPVEPVGDGDRVRIDPGNTVESTEPTEPIEPEFASEDGEDAEGSITSITIGGDEFMVGAFSGDLRTHQPLSAEAIPVGTTVGVYAHPIEGTEPLMWLARFVDTAPGPHPGPQLGVMEVARRSQATGMVIFALMAALIGLCIGAVDGLLCRMYRRAAVSGMVGLGIGFLGGFVISIVANLIYAPLAEIAQEHSQSGPGAVGGLTLFGFSIQMMGRTLAWGMVGVAMGLGQGVALRSRRLLLFGLLGGVVGGVLGGLLFDPIDLLLLGEDKPSAHISRLIGFMVIGANVGGMIGVVELLTRDAWLRMEQGPLAGKEFLVFKDVMKVGSSPRSDIYLFNDPQVKDHHATLRMVGENLEIESVDSALRVLLNDRAITRSRLRHGDRITLGRTTFVYQRRGG